MTLSHTHFFVDGLSDLATHAVLHAIKKFFIGVVEKYPNITGAQLISYLPNLNHIRDLRHQLNESLLVRTWQLESFIFCFISLVFFVFFLEPHIM